MPALSRSMARLTAVGSNPNVWANDFIVFHALLYMKTKGLAEQAVIKQGFERVSIFRPSTLDRGDQMRPFEKLIIGMTGAHNLSELASSIVMDATRPDAKPGVSIFSAASLKKSAKENKPPVA